MYWTRISLAKQEKFSISEEEIKCALRNWAQDSISHVTERADALWKFLIGMSALTIAGVAYMTEKIGFGSLRLIGIGLLGLSILVAIISNWPLTMSLSSSDNILEKFRQSVFSNRLFSLIWFFLWLAGGIFGFFPMGEESKCVCQ